MSGNSTNSQGTLGRHIDKYNNFLANRIVTATAKKASQVVSLPKLSTDSFNPDKYILGEFIDDSLKNLRRLCLKY